MRRHIAVVTLLSLFAVSAVAQEKTDEVPKGKFRVFAFGSNFGYTQSDLSGSNWHGGYGLGLEYRLRERWSAELSVSRERTGTWGYTVVGRDGVIESRRFSVTSHPIDLVGQYHFSTRSAWKPFVGLGLRYVDAERPGFPYPTSEARLAPQFTGGFYYNFTRNLGLRVDVKRLFGNESTFYDDERKASVGLGWTF